jgi:hypothetical protein
MKMKAILSAAIFLELAQTAGAQLVAQHSGSTNPGTEGFVNNNGGPIYGSPVIASVTTPSSWNMTGPWPFNYNQYVLSAAQSTALATNIGR